MRRIPSLLLVASILLLPAVALAQPVQYIHEDLEFDRPESWAMKYFASISLLSTLAAPRERPAGAIDASLELSTIPSLSARERTVGFHGTKEEDLNKLPALVRPRVTIALPRDFSVTAAWVPPVGLNGVRANIVSLGVGKAIFRRDVWNAAANLYGQSGTIRGAFTCPEDFVKFDPQGLYGCERPSSDTTKLRYVGLELSGGRRITALGSPTLQISGAVNYLDLDFQVNALTFGFIDRRHMFADGTTWTAGAGATWAVAPRTDLGVNIFYAPLGIRRLDANVENDPLVNARILLRYRLR
ncbi:MAG: hypothetical protein WBX15_10975 [Thermoanaerobaculia bacterium]